MSVLRPRSLWPLVGKELVEQAARPRTYVLRTLYAGALFLAFVLVFLSWRQQTGDDPMAIIGRGQWLFHRILLFQFVGIFVFLPAMMCSAITAEKERDSLALLLLTDMTPRQIIREKLVGRLVPMFIYLLLSMPLMALAYSMGGFSAGDIWFAAYFLFLTCAQVGALSLMCSAYARTTVGAFLATYAVGGFTYLFPFLCPMRLYAQAMDSHRKAGAMAASILSWVTVLFFLSLARRFLLTRASAPPTNRLMIFFRALDRFWHGVNQNFGGVVLIRESHDLPGSQPVYWRETQRKALGKLNYLFRILVAIEGPAILIGLFMAFMRIGYVDEAEGLSIMVGVLWILAVLAIATRGADLIVSERSSQTLETLLTTPMTGADILREKMLSIYRLIIVLAIPILTTALIEAHLEYERSGRNGDFYATYLFFTFLSLVIYLPLFAWTSLWIGLMARSRVRAIIGALMAIVAWCVVPLVAVAAMKVWGIQPHQHVVGWDSGSPYLDRSVLLYLSPATAVAGVEHEGLRVSIGDSRAYETIWLVNYLFYAAILLLVRWWCLRRADVLLGRLKVTGRPRRGEVAPVTEDSAPAS